MAPKLEKISRKNLLTNAAGCGKIGKLSCIAQDLKAGAEKDLKNLKKVLDKQE